MLAPSKPLLRYVGAYFTVTGALLGARWRIAGTTTSDSSSRGAEVTALGVPVNRNRPVSKAVSPGFMLRAIGNALAVTRDRTLGIALIGGGDLGPFRRRQCGGDGE